MRKALINISGRTNGGPVIAIELAKALAKNGFEVYAIVAQDTLNLQDWLNEKSIKEVYTIKTYTSMKDLFTSNLRFLLHEKGKIKKHFAGIEFDYVFKPIFHLWAEEIISVIKAKKIITLCHDPIMHSGESKVKQILYKKHIKNSDEVVVLTKSFIPIVSKNYGFDRKNIHYMPLGLIHLYKEKQKDTTTCIFNSNSVNFVFFGRIEKYKGIGVLIAAYNLLKKKKNNISLTIAGKGDVSEYLEQIEKDDSIRLYNKYIPDEEVGIYFDGPNVVTILPYLDATQSGVIPIAMEYGCPIIASETGGLKEQMLDGQFGIYFKTGDAEDLSIKMLNIIESKDEFNKQRELMNKAMDKLEWEYVVHELLFEI